jgi:putative phosphoesterase
MELGLISDTHGLIRREALEALRGVDRIVHAGDVGDAAVLRALGDIADVVAVRGNNDRGTFGAALPPRAALTFGGARIVVVHELADLDAEASREPPPDIVVFGHSHRPSVERRSGTLLVNPGSAGPRRFNLPVTVARLEIEGARIATRIVELDVDAPAEPRGEGANARAKKRALRSRQNMPTRR